SITVEKVFQNDQLRVDFGKASQKLYQTQAWQSFRADLKNEWQSFLFHGKVDSSGSVSEVLDEDITLCLFLINRSGFLQASQELQDLDVPEVYKHIQVANFDYRQSGYVHVGMAGKANETEFIQQFSRPFIPGQQDIWVLDHHDVDAPSAFSLLYYLLKTSGYISSDQYSTWDKIEEFASLLECYGANGVALGMKQLLPLYKNKEKKEFFMSPDNSRKLYACQSLYVIYKYLNYQSNKTQLFEDLEKIYQYLSQDSVPFSTPLDYKHLVDM
ncbi:MAG: hypothetical protein U9Q15_05260, partial [Patescibacteria group bacterium]|nr:hypothetical protein [Patescibacteria group bacterium]